MYKSACRMAMQPFHCQKIMIHFAKLIRTFKMERKDIMGFLIKNPCICPHSKYN